MYIPADFKVGDKYCSKYVLNFKKSLYGPEQASLNRSEMLKSDLVELGYKPSQVDPCLCHNKDVICVVYVDITIFWSSDESKIEETISEHKALKFELFDKGGVNLFLEIKIRQDESSNITMIQRDLMETIIKTVVLENDSN